MGWWRRLARREEDFRRKRLVLVASVRIDKADFPTPSPGKTILVRRGTMESHNDDQPKHEAPQRGEAEVRAMMEQSRRDIAAGRLAPLALVLNRMRTMADRMRNEMGGHDERDN